MGAESQLWVWHTVEASLRKGIDIRDEFTAQLTEAGINKDEANTWKLCYSEAFTNACKHGSPSSNSTIKIGWSINENYTSLHIIDCGQGPTREQLSNISLPEDPLSEGGRGLYILSELCDNIKHWNGEDGHLIEMMRFHDVIDNEDDSENGNDALLNELGACYESLATFYRMGERLTNLMDASQFCQDSLDELKESHNYDYLELLKANNCNSMHVWNDIKEKPSMSFVPADLKQGCLIPVQTEGRNWGCLLAGRLEPCAVIRSSERDVLKTVADMLGMTLANEQLMEERDAKQKALKEYELARDLQISLLPIRNKSGLDKEQLVICRKSAKEIAGDFADAQKLADGSKLLFIADVMGKGVQAASLALVLRSLYFHVSKDITDPAKILDLLNQSLVDFLGDVIVFATCAIVKISPDGQEAEIANAGHLPVICQNKKGIKEYPPSGMPLGIESNQTYINNIIELSKDDRIYMATDGYYEWKKENGSTFGWGPFKEILTEQSDLPLPSAMENLNNLIKEKSSNTISDDQTLIIWRAK